MTTTLSPANGLLGPVDPDPVGILPGPAAAPFFLICDHAGNAVPERLGGLGIERAELDRHIGIDIGALPIAQSLAGRLRAPLLFQRYSRLVIDCNRQLSAPDSIPEVSDGTPIPANRGLGEAERAERVAAIHKPYHAAIEAALERRLAEGPPPIVVSVHTYTPMLRARPAPRPWQVALMWADDGRFSERVIAALARDPGLNVGRNEPYSVNLRNDHSIPVHVCRRELTHVEFEIRQDLASTPAETEAWAACLAVALNAALDGFEESAR